MPASKLIVKQVFPLVSAVVALYIEVFPGIESSPKIRVSQVLLYAIRLADQVDIVAGKVGEIRRHQFAVAVRSNPRTSLYPRSSSLVRAVISVV